MESLEWTISTELTVKQLQKWLQRSDVNLKGEYKKEKPYFVKKLIEVLDVSNLKFPIF